ncbi:MAG TPA: hypothetical protein VMR41_00080 [Patescibacteria group bacterium]|nr:hypothetical protein [Patescibacteria group bacterium]
MTERAKTIALISTEATLTLGMPFGLIPEFSKVLSRRAESGIMGIIGNGSLYTIAIAAACVAGAGVYRTVKDIQEVRRPKQKISQPAEVTVYTNTKPED